MAGGPWDKYIASKPWAKYAGPSQAAGPVKTLSQATEYKTWPERLIEGIFETAKSGATLPHDVKTGEVDPFSDEAIRRSADLAVMTPVGQGLKASGMAAKATIAPKIAARNELVQAANRQNIALPVAAATDSMPVQRMGQVVAGIPLGGSALKRASEQAIEQTGKAAGRVASDYGGGAAANPASAGATIRSGLERYIGPTTEDRVTKAYDAVDNLVKPDVTVPLAKTGNVANTILAEREAAGLKGAGPAVELINEAVKRPEGLTYQGVKTLRTRVGEMLKGGVLPADMSQTELKKIYGALSKDLRFSVAIAGGPKASQAFERANTYNALVQDRRESLATLLGVKNDEGVYDRLMRAAGSTSTADAKLLMKARKAMPADEWDTIASATVQRMGRGANGNGEFSPAVFLTAYQKLSPAGKQALFASTGKKELAGALDDLAKVSGRFKQLDKYANPSRTGSFMAGAGSLYGLSDPVSFGTALATTAAASHMMARRAAVKGASREGGNLSKALLYGSTRAPFAKNMAVTPPPRGR